MTISLLPPLPAPPTAPHRVAQLGLPWPTLRTLVLRHLFVADGIAPPRLAAALAVTPSVVGELITRLTGDAAVDCGGLWLTEEGRLAGRESFRRSRYVGPLPVTAAAWTEQAERQRLAARRIDLAAALQPLAVPPATIDRLGPAVVDARSLLLYGRDGNGKRAIGRAIAAELVRHAGPIWVPTAVLAGDRLVTVFDASQHHPVTRHCGPVPPDPRFRCVRRPVVTLCPDAPSADPAATAAAPTLALAAGGVGLLDADAIHPADRDRLLAASDRERIDIGGTPLPATPTVILHSADVLAATTSLRRVRHKVPVRSPDRVAFARLLDTACRERSVAIDPQAAGVLWDTVVQRTAGWTGSRVVGTEAGSAKSSRRPRVTLRASDAADLVEIAVSICRFREQPAVIRPAVLLDAARQFLPAA